MLDDMANALLAFVAAALLAMAGVAVGATPSAPATTFGAAVVATRPAYDTRNGCAPFAAGPPPPSPAAAVPAPTPLACRYRTCACCAT